MFLCYVRPHCRTCLYFAEILAVRGDAQSGGNWRGELLDDCTHHHRGHVCEGQSKQGSRGFLLRRSSGQV